MEKKLLCIILFILQVPLLWAQYNPDNPGEPGIYYQLTLTNEPFAGGSVTPSGSTQAEAGDTIICRAYPASGYRFLYWRAEDGTHLATTDSLEFVMPANDVTLTAVYEWNPIDPEDPDARGYSYKIYLTASPVSGGRFMNDKQLVVEGDTAKVQAYANTGYVFESWERNGVIISTENPLSFLMGSEDVYLTANFKYSPDSPGDPLPAEIVDSVPAPIIERNGNKIGMHVDFDDAIIYYTMNGEIPDSTSMVYTDSIVVTNNCTIMAIAMHPWLLASKVVTLEVRLPEPYAVLSNNNTVLTFYYDDQKEAREGMSVGPLVSDYERGWYEARESITSVVFDASFADCTTLTSTAYWFASCSNLTTITDIQYLKTDNVTDMRYMFIGCSGLTTLDLSSFSTSNVTNMGSMFYGCSNLATIYASYDWDNSHVTNGDNMFYGCYGLRGGKGTVYEPDCTNVGFAHIDEGTAYPGYFTDKNAPQPYAVLSEGNTVLTFYYDDQREAREGMSVGPFTDYNQSEWYDVRGSITSVVFDASFADCTYLTSTASWFAGCYGLTTITGIQYLNTDNVKNMNLMFYNCSGFTSLDLSCFNTDKVTSMDDMFSGCSHLTSLDLSSFNTSNVTKMWGMFFGCSSLTTIYVGEGWSTANVTESENMFFGCTNLVGGMGTTYDTNHKDAAYAHIDGGTNNPGYFTDKNGTVVVDEVTAYAVLSDNMRKMTLYYDMDKESHTEGPVILWSELQASHEMINARETLVTIDFDPSFAGLTTLTSTNYLFSGCRNLTAINGLEYLVTDNMTDMNEMFVSCESLTVLDLSSFNTSKVTSMFGMFMDCRNLTTIIVGDGWDISALTDGGHEMFAGCTSLVGGMGTTYSDPNFNADYAHVDGGPSNPGYLTGTDEPDITEFEVDGIWYRVRPRGEHEVFVAHVMYGDQEIYIPSEVEYARSHWRVTALGERAFADLHEVAVIEVPESIDSISIDLFNHCNHLAAIIWQSSTPLTTAAMGEFNNPNLLLYVREKASAPATITNIVDMTNFTADKIVLSDAETGNDFYCPEPFMAKEISYTHSYDQATRIGVCQGWESIVLPFDVQTFMHETKGEIYPIASLLDEQIEYDGDKPFWLYEFTMQGEFREAEQIRANTPYIISMPNDPAYWDSYILSGKVTFKSTNVEVYPTHHAMYVEGGNRVFVPNFANADYSNPDAYLLNVGDAYEGHLPGSVFSAERENRRARPFEAYFYYNGQHPAKRYIGVFDEDASAIREIPVSSKTMKGAYDLAGRKVDAESQLPKGIYIIDGKKVMVK